VGMIGWTMVLISGRYYINRLKSRKKKYLKKKWCGDVE